MAVIRTAPKCNKCGKEAKAVYKDESDMPMSMRTIGDTFLYWEAINCDCDNEFKIDLGGLFPEASNTK